jgi:hypothetical protein
MKKMTYGEIGGSCDEVFQTESFEEMAKLSKAHVMEMFGIKDQGHINTVNEMAKNCPDQTSMLAWISERKAYFDSL